jgi:hypothetical protein
VITAFLHRKLHFFRCFLHRDFLHFLKIRAFYKKVEKNRHFKTVQNTVNTAFLHRKLMFFRCFLHRKILHFLKFWAFLMQQNGISKDTTA